MIVVAVALAAALTGCADEAENDGAGGTTVEPSPETETTTPAPEETPIDPNDPESVAIADLAEHLDVDEGAIEVVTHEQVTWRNGSLGCPEPGMMYTQALVEGYRIVLRADGQDVAYHGADGGAPARCDDPDPNGAVPNPNT